MESKNSESRSARNNIDVTLAREDLAFCLPLSINLCHADRAGMLLIMLHLVTLAIVIVALPVLPGLALSLALLVSMLFSLLQQRRIADFDSLRCDQSGRWSLAGFNGNQPGQQQWVRLDSLMVAGSFCLLRLRRFGSSVYWISDDRHQAAHDWRRLRVLSRLL